MVKFTRSGGEAGAVAMRIARAAAGRSHVAFCGYHGWHDWYLSANLAESDLLDGHLLPGLEPAGVPRQLSGSAEPFEFNNLESLREVVKRNSSGVIYMEVERATPPTPEFLQGARELATEVGAVLVFDECTSGFRSVLGGQHLKYGVNPDIVVLGKTLGNGYAINAVVGSREVMEHAQDSFISSTFWTERIGPTAAVATLKEMELSGAPHAIDAIGKHWRRNLQLIVDGLDLDIIFTGMPALTSFTIEGSTAQELKTFLTQELLKKGLLGGISVYFSLAHTEDVLDRHLAELAKILGEHHNHIREGGLLPLLDAGLAQQGFARLA